MSWSTMGFVFWWGLFIHFVFIYVYVSNLLLSSENIYDTRPYSWDTQWDMNALLFAVWMVFSWLWVNMDDTPLFFLECIFLSLLLLYSHLHHHSASQRHNIKDRRMNKRRMNMTQEGRRKKTSLEKYSPPHFIARVRKGCSRFACERVLETEHKLHILTPLLWRSRCVFLVLLDAQPEVFRVHCWMLAFFTASLSASSLDPSSSGLQAPSAWCGFPYHIWSLTHWKSAGNCSGTRTQLS